MNKQFVIIVVITFFVGMVWLVADIIFNTKASIQISPKLEVLLKQVNPNFNSRLLEIIDKETLDTSSIIVNEVPEVTIEPDLPNIDEESTESAEIN